MNNDEGAGAFAPFVRPVRDDEENDAGSSAGPASAAGETDARLAARLEKLHGDHMVDVLAEIQDEPATRPQSGVRR